MSNVIRVGDATSHGGKVLSSGVDYFVVDGKPVVVVGDKCICPINGHQTARLPVAVQRTRSTANPLLTMATRHAVAPH